MKPAALRRVDIWCPNICAVINWGMAVNGAHVNIPGLVAAVV
jgi:hypothetical protein